MVKQRFQEIDFVKTISILGVVLVHSLDTQQNILLYKTPIEQFIGDWVRFVVPGFLFSSGFLFNKSGMNTLELAKRIARRIIPPYLFCSLVILALRTVWIAPPLATFNPLYLLRLFFFGETFGIYYFVFVIGYLYAFSLWLRKWKRRWIYLLYLLEVAATVIFCFKPAWLLSEQEGIAFFLYFRHPVIHLLPYMTGWILSLHYGEIKPFLQKNRTWLFTAIVVLDASVLAIITRFRPQPFYTLLIYLHIYLWLAIALYLGMLPRPGTRLIRFFSEGSYSIYLIHYPFVLLAKDIRNSVLRVDFPLHFLTTWAFSLLCSVILISAARKISAKYSRLLLGT